MTFDVIVSGDVFAFSTGTSGKTHFCAGQAFLELTPDVR
jgi:hypothetical protein